MSKRNPPARYELPEVVNPSTTVCFQIPVPNDKFHIAAFKGSILALGRAFSWANDDAHTAKDVAAVWMDIFNNLEECSPMIQFRQLESCLLEFSLDAGVTWEVAYDGSSCVREGIVDAIQDGTVSGGGQQPPGGSGTPGQCYTYHVRLEGNGSWVSPIPVESGDTITISNTFGAWHDGSAYAWHCPNGYSYALGSCLGIGNVTDPTDPAPSVYHMRLIGHIPTETAPYFDIYDTTYNVTSSTSTPQDLRLQANDSSAGDNQGSITFDVEICKGGWCYTWDFRADPGPFTAYMGRATWVAGQGWIRTGADNNMQMQYLFSSRHIDFIGASRSGTAAGVVAALFAPDPSASEMNIVAPFVGTETGLQPTNSTITGLWLSIGNVDSSPETDYMTAATVRGKSGSNPFGSDNC